MFSILENIALKDFTTIRLGGSAKYFCSCTSVDELKEALRFAEEKKIRAHLLGRGSNTIFSDNGFNGLVIKIDLKGVSVKDDSNDAVIAVKAGEDWDPFVRMCVEKGYAGIECLSGIPGLVGATPIQNVGAYGQEVKDTIVSVKVLERETLKETEFRNDDCNFSYRSSRFKSFDGGKYIVTEVTFRLRKNGRPAIHYPEVKKIVEGTVDLPNLPNGRGSLEAVRNVVLTLRKNKSMVIDPGDPNSRSVGSFFLNPVVGTKVYSSICEHWKMIGDGTDVPAFPFENKKKIPAAWLIERSGFKKGYRKNGVGISENHTLALVNYNGTTKEILDLAQVIQNGVQKIFDISLEMEANIVSE